MKICQQHWKELRDEVDRQGLSPFISEGGGAAHAKMVGQLRERPKSETFDPLLNANFAIWSNALSVGGLYLMGVDEEGEPYCPICESEKHGGYPASWWIENAVKEQFEAAKALGLVGEA